MTKEKSAKEKDSSENGKTEKGELSEKEKLKRYNSGKGASEKTLKRK